jgi:hypothetical protein
MPNLQYKRDHRCQQAFANSEAIGISSVLWTASFSSVSPQSYLFAQSRLADVMCCSEKGLKV